MPINLDARNNILSILLDIAKCEFVRVTEYKQKNCKRYQYGDESVGALALGQKIENNAKFVAEQQLHIHEYQLNISLLAKNHLHIECLKSNVNQNSGPIGEESRKNVGSTDQHPPYLEIELVSGHTLLDHLMNLGKYGKRHEDLSNGKQTQIFLNTIIATLETFRLITQYTELTRDSLTKLKSRSALQRSIDEKILHSSMALCMVHCIDFQHVNRKFGQEQGDTVLHEIASVIEQQTRADDVSGRFGGALFGIAIHASSIEDGYDLASKLQEALHNKHYLKNAVRLSFNIGIAFVSQEEDRLDSTSTSSLLINRAEQALKAAQNSLKPSIVRWEADKFRLDEQEFNYLGGIFTPDNVTNYRNMLLLWDISSIIADEHSFSRLLKSVVERLAFTFEFSHSGIVALQTVENSQNFSFKLNDGTDIEEIDWQSYEFGAVLENTAKQAIESSQHTKYEDEQVNALVVPLGTSTQESFFIIGEKDRLDLTHDTVMLFVGFARQLGKALNRSQLEDELNKNLEKQNAKLAQELLELKAGLQSSALVYRSEVMQKIVEQTQRAAQTDATVLVTGESGTGKEKLINAIHNLSPRSNKPLVIVDCGSIPETLIESELFGHTKGAFTGAQSDSKGKIQAANGGILVLDEIGELPISMQPKLLRFVQEKHYTPVGSNKAISVDVKIVAVTNRDLAYEVSQGKFRKDLYYRLNVVSLHNPPLRERIEDIELLCQHFLSKFSRQFEMDKKHLSPKTIEAMKAYPWPGNIRELENKLMQASLLTTSDEIKFEDLNIEAISVKPHRKTIDTEKLHTNLVVSNFKESKNVGNDAYSNDLHHPNAAAPYYENQEMHSSNQALNEESWTLAFSNTLEQLLDNLDIRILTSIPLGSLVEALLLNMAQKECHSHSKTAVLLQMPISTARRRLRKAPPDMSMLEDNHHWHSIKTLFEAIIQKRVILESPVELVRNLTAKAILEQHSSNMALASQIMDVSEPTMYKFRKSLSY